MRDNFFGNRDAATGAPVEPSGPSEQSRVSRPATPSRAEAARPVVRQSPQAAPQDVHQSASHEAARGASRGASPPPASTAKRDGAAAGAQLPQVSLVERICSRVVLSEFVGRYVKLKGNGREKVGLCPFHDEGTPSFAVNDDKGVFLCRGCRASGNVVRFKAMIEGVDEDVAKVDLAKELGVYVERTASPEVALLASTATRYHNSLKKRAADMRYLVEERGLKPETINEWEIGYCYGNEFDSYSGEALERAERAGILYRTAPDDAGKTRLFNLCSRRIVFPIRSADGRVVAFGGRKTLDSQAAKYVNTADTRFFAKSETLFGFNMARRNFAQLGYAVVVEGYMDVVALHQEGIGTAVAVMGAQAGPKAFDLLWGATKRIVFCLDGDAAGKSGALRSVMAAANTMVDGCRIDIASLPDGLDPDEFILTRGKAAFERLVEDAVPLANYLVEIEAEKADFTSVDGRAQFIASVKRRSDEFTNAPLLREQMEVEAHGVNWISALKMIAKRSHLSLSSLEIEQLRETLSQLEQCGSESRRPSGPRR